MTVKPFDKRLYEENDRIAKKTAGIFILSIMGDNWEIEEDKEMYSKCDFIIRNKDTDAIRSFEVEIKNVWTKDKEWQGWDTIDVPYRKIYNESDFFIMLNRNLNTLAITGTTNILSSSIIKKSCRVYNKDGTLNTKTKDERFFRVSLKHFHFYTIGKNKEWRKIDGKC